MSFPDLQNKCTGRPDLSAAKAIFNEIAATPAYIFDYIETGCYERSFVICDKFKKAGYRPQKIWAYQREEKPLICQVGVKCAQWIFHVAPVIHVQVTLDETIPLVFDPTIFDAPVEIKQWSGQMQNMGNYIITEAEFIPKRFRAWHSKKWDACVNKSMRALHLLRKDVAHLPKVPSEKHYSMLYHSHP